jgi:hypothetical protein
LRFIAAFLVETTVPANVTALANEGSFERVRQAGSFASRPFSIKFVFVIDQDESGFLGQQMAMGVKVLTIVKSLTGSRRPDLGQQGTVAPYRKGLSINMWPNSQTAFGATLRQGLQTRLPDSFRLHAGEGLWAFKPLPGKSQC